MNNAKMTAIEESEYGVYFWVDTNGKILADEEYRPLCVNSKKGDMTKVMALKEVAFAVMRENGMEPGGQPRFSSGRRQVTDHEYEEQVDRMNAGLIPDKYDVAALKEEAKYAKKRND